MLEIAGIRVSLDEDMRAQTHGYAHVVARACGISEREIKSCVLLKRSVDARKKVDVHILISCALEVSCACESLLLEKDSQRKLSSGMHVKPYVPYRALEIPQVNSQDAPRCVVVGSGPAGLFAAWYLAQAGCKPLLIERGECVDERLDRVAQFNAGGVLNPESNIQFGEGGAGTFSDGKLTTNTKNPRIRDVLHIFAQAGAPEEILWQAKPHIGTDKLIHVVRTMREQICSLGGSVRFDTRLDKIIHTDNRVCQLVTTNVKTHQVSTIDCDVVVLAIGHSARDTFEMLHQQHFAMEPKPFSVGVRIEHKQALINKAQYGKAAHHPALGAADYKLSAHVKSGRGVYTFCMCPGGEVVCATSEAGGVVVNGMSEHARAGSNANSAILVGVDPQDFGGSPEDPLAGVEFQRSLERAAYEESLRCGGKPYQAPSQRVGEFMSGCPAELTKRSPQPTYARGTVSADLHAVLPEFVCTALQEALPIFDRRIQGFASSDAIMTAVETRSSSPVRIIRDKDYQSNIAGVYPAGEGAGYAGGIMSAAVDGLRIAQSIVSAMPLLG